MDATGDLTAFTVAVSIGFAIFAAAMWAVVSLCDLTTRTVGRHTPSVSARHFSLLELLLFAGQLQLALAFTPRSLPVPSYLLLVTLIGIGWGCAFLRSAGFLSRNLITCRLRRCLLLGGTTPIQVAATAAALWINGNAVLQTCLGRDWPLAPWLAKNLLIAVALAGCHLVTLWCLERRLPRFRMAAMPRSHP